MSEWLQEVMWETNRPAQGQGLPRASASAELHRVNVGGENTITSSSGHEHCVQLSLGHLSWQLGFSVLFCFSFPFSSLTWINFFFEIKVILFFYNWEHPIPPVSRLIVRCDWGTCFSGHFKGYFVRLKSQRRHHLPHTHDGLRSSQGALLKGRTLWDAQQCSVDSCC